MVVNCIYWLPRNQEGRISDQNFITETGYFTVLSSVLHSTDDPCEFTVTPPSLLLLFPQHITLLQRSEYRTEGWKQAAFTEHLPEFQKEKSSLHCTTHLISPPHPLPRSIFWKEKTWGKVFPNTTPSTQVLRNITLNLERTLNTYMLRREGNEPGDGSHPFLLDFREHLKARNQHGVHVGYSAT